MLRTVIAYIILGIFFGTEGRLRQGQAALSLAPGEEDRGSTRVVGAAFGIMINALVLAPLLNRLRVGRLRIRPVVLWAGIPIMVVGVLLHAWGTRTLGEFYTRTLVTSDKQRILQKGPYRVLRHPGYLGSILMWIGAALAAANGIALALAVVTMLTAYIYRIHSEEEMLRQTFGEEFEEYQSRTWKLIPGVY